MVSTEPNGIVDYQELNKVIPPLLTAMPLAKYIWTKWWIWLMLSSS
jgi:hypothetical protein